MKELQLGNDTIIAVEVPEGASGFEMIKKRAHMQGEHYMHYVSYRLNDEEKHQPFEVDGEYEIIGLAKPVNNEEMPSKEFMERLKMWMKVIKFVEEIDKVIAEHSLTPNTLLIKKIG